MKGGEKRRAEKSLDGKGRRGRSEQEKGKEKEREGH